MLLGPMGFNLCFSFAFSKLFGSKGSLLNLLVLICD